MSNKTLCKIYEYKGEKYIPFIEVPFKHPETREWVTGILYKQLSSGLPFVREKEEFFKLFKEE